jgi:hypothetical protein
VDLTLKAPSSIATEPDSCEVPCFAFTLTINKTRGAFIEPGVAPLIAIAPQTTSFIAQCTCHTLTKQQLMFVPFLQSFPRENIIS